MENCDVEMFSLEDDDASELFITQTPRNFEQNNDKSEDEFDFGEYLEVTGDHVVKEDKVNDSVPVYSDISDPEDDFVNPIYGRTVK